MVVTDDGTVFQTSVAYLKNLLESGNAGRFALLTEMPYKVSASRFPKSPLYKGVTSINLPSLDYSKSQSDPFSVKAREKAELNKPVLDSGVDW